MRRLDFPRSTERGPIEAFEILRYDIGGVSFPRSTERGPIEAPAAINVAAGAFGLSAFNRTRPH